MKRIHVWHVELILVVALTGCATTQNPQSTHTAPAAASGSNTAATPAKPKLTAAQRKAAEETARDKVLFQYRDAAIAMRSGRYSDAKVLLDDALLTLGGVHGKDKNAKKARSYFSAENTKTFIGEPYERIMAYYYRGILYWMDGEPDNARACFRTGELEDASNEDKYSADYVLLDYLDGLVTTKLGGDGSDAFQRATNLCTKGEKLPPYDSQAKALFFVEFGPGPTKISTGEYREQLRFRVPESRVTSALLRINDQTLQLAPYDDLGFQATTRGGRVMDHVLANKVVFKDTTKTIGTAAIVGGVIAAAASGDKTVRQAALGVAAAGAVVSIVSGLATPAADVRAWDNLPRYLAFAALRLPPGQHAATIEFLGKDGQPLLNLTKTIPVGVLESAHDTIVFVSDRSKDGQLPQFTETDPAKIANRVQTAAATFHQAASQMQDRGISETLIFRAQTDLSKAQQALVRSVDVGDTKWRIMQEASVDADTLMVRMIGKSFLGTPRRAWVQLCQIADNDVEIRAKLTALPGADHDLSMPERVAILKQVEAKACSNFKANLEAELGTPLRTMTE